jgi:pimeloyl-ACP methyl ester carboxylesterase
MLPGLLCDHALWRHQVEALADLADPWIADLTRADNVEEMARSVLEQAPERFALAGLSMGGYVCFEILRQAPRRVSRLALLDTKASPDSPEQRRRRRGLLSLASKGRFKGVTPQLLPMLLHEDRLEDAKLTGIVMAMAERVGRDAFIRQQTAILARPDSRPLLPGIDVPTLVLCGKEDALTPMAEHKAMAEAIPNAELTVVPHCGHLAPLERPEAVNAALRRWLRSGDSMRV